VLELQPGHLEARLGLGLARRAQGDAEGAVAELLRVLPQKADDPQLHVALGDLYRRLRQPQAAVTHLSEAARLAPHDAGIQFQLGLALADSGDLDRAMAAFQRTVELRPDDADAHYNLGVVVGEKIRALVDEKVAAYRKAATLRPGQADAHYYLGVAYIQKAQISRVEDKRALLQLALEQFRLFHQSAPQDPKAPAAAHNIQVLEPQVQ
jgi:Flp pilus assembly protein TadD